jgi:hypothetical protein
LLLKVGITLNSSVSFTFLPEGLLKFCMGF